MLGDRHDGAERYRRRLGLRVLAATPDHVSVLDRDFVYRYVNPAYERAHARTAAEIVGKSAASLLGRDVFDAVARPALLQCLGGEEVAYQAWFEFEGSGRRFMSVRYLPLHSEQDEVEAIVVLSHDLTAQRRSEAALERSEEKYRRYISDAINGIFVVDQGGNYVEVNPAAERMTGYRSEELLTMNIGQLVPEEDVADVRADFGRLLGEGQLHRRLRLRRKDGTPFWVNLAASRLDEDRYMAFCQDVSREVEIEEQLRQAQKMEALGQLAGGVAHDFNNLLTAMVGYASVIVADPAAAPVRSEAMEILSAGRRAAELTRQLLTFSRREARRDSSVDLNVLVSELDDMLGRLIGANIALEIHLAPSGCVVNGDKGQLEQVVINVILNARDALSEGGKIEVTVSHVELEPRQAADQGLEAGAYGLLTVQDDGAGMSPEVRERAFEPFFTTKPRGRGSGLGLATAYGVIAGFRGRIRVSSEVGKGTRFEILLPGSDLPPKPSQPELVQRSRRGTGSILIVEDDSGVRSLTAHALREAGYHVTVAASSHEALELVTEDRIFDLLVSDVVLPGASGPELFQVCSGRQPSLRVLFISGYPGKASGGFTALDGERPLLEKPFTPAELAEAVAVVLERDR